MQDGRVETNETWIFSFRVLHLLNRNNAQIFFQLILPFEIKFLQFWNCMENNEYFVVRKRWFRNTLISEIKLQFWNCQENDEYLMFIGTWFNQNILFSEINYISTSKRDMKTMPILSVWTLPLFNQDDWTCFVFQPITYAMIYMQEKDWILKLW